MSDMTQDGGYISARRASDISGYSRDYIGQLARRGKVAAKRIGGLWYVLEESLRGHIAEPSATHVIRSENLRRAASEAKSESFVAFDGIRYVSAATAAKTTGYHQDYIGQLARGGKVLSRHMGSRWFVELSSLISHKSERDSMLAAVQSEAVGLRSRDFSTSKSNNFYKMHFTYTKDDGELHPTINSFKEAVTREIEGEHERRNIPINILRLAPVEHRAGRDEARAAQVRLPGMTIFYWGFPVALTVVILVAFHINLYNAIPVLARSSTSGVIRNTALAGILEAQVRTLTRVVEGIFGDKLIYDRRNRNRDF